MTLNIMLVSKWGAYQCADFRLTDLQSGEYYDNSAQKQLLVNNFRWSATIQFAGVGQTPTVDVSKWLADKVSNLGWKAEFDDLLTALQDADIWLRPLKGDKRVTFSVAAFIGSKPVAVLVSNCEIIDGKAQNTAGSKLRVTQKIPRRAQLFLTGYPAAAEKTDRILLRQLLQRNADRIALHNSMAAVNVRASASPKSNYLISPSCYTTNILPDGTGEGMLHGRDDTTGYVPHTIQNIFDKIGIRINPARDEDGNPKSIQVKGMTFARSTGQKQKPK